MGINTTTVLHDVARITRRAPTDTRPLHHDREFLLTKLCTVRSNFPKSLSAVRVWAAVGEQLSLRSSRWDLRQIGLAIVIGLVVHAALYAPRAAFLSELFGTEVRFRDGR
jgi:hypothetical protein